MRTHPTLYIVDRPGEGLALHLQDTNRYATESYFSGAAFLETAHIVRPGCLVMNIHLADMEGVDLLERVRRDSDVPVIMAGEQWEMEAVMRSIRLGGVDFCSKPVEVGALRERVQQTLTRDAQWTEIRTRVEGARRKMASLTQRQRELMGMFASGLSQKEIAAALDLSPRTVENHRARLNARLGTSRLAEYFQLHLLAGGSLLAGGEGTARHADGPARWWLDLQRAQ